MTGTLRNLAGSKVWGWVGAAIAALAGVCLAMEDKIVIAMPGLGERFCAVMVVLGAVVAWLSKSPASRRTGGELDTVKLPTGEIIPNRRMAPRG